MSVFSLLLAKMLCALMNLLMLVMFLVPGLSGLVLLSALADAYRFCEGPIPSRGLVLVVMRCLELFRLVGLW